MGELRCRNGKRLKILVLKRRTDQKRHDLDAWPIEADVVGAARLHGCTHVLLEVEDGTRLMTLVGFVGRQGEEHGVKLHVRTYKDPRIPAERQWLVPTRLFAANVLPQDKRDDAMIKQMTG